MSESTSVLLAKTNILDCRMIIYINKSEARTETELPSQYLIIAEETSPITATDNQQEREANTDTLVSDFATPLGVATPILGTTVLRR